MEAEQERIQVEYEAVLKAARAAQEARDAQVARDLEASENALLQQKELEKTLNCWKLKAAGGSSWNNGPQKNSKRRMCSAAWYMKRRTLRPGRTQRGKPISASGNHCQ